MLNGGLAFWLCCSSEWKGGVPLKIDGTNLICRGLGRVALCTLTVEDLSQLENFHTRGSQVPLFSVASRSLGRFGSSLNTRPLPPPKNRDTSFDLTRSAHVWDDGFGLGSPRAWIRASILNSRPPPKHRDKGFDLNCFSLQGWDEGLGLGQIWRKVFC